MNYEYINPLIQFGYEQYDLVIKNDEDILFVLS